MKLRDLHSRLSLRTRLIASASLLTGSALLLVSHASAVRSMKETGLPSAMHIPAVEQRMNMLREQADIAELRASVGGGAQQELLHAYVLPSSPELDRLLGTFDVIIGHLEQAGQLRRISPVNVGSAQEVTPGGTGEPLQSLPVTFDIDVSEDGFGTLLRFIGISGRFTVSDLLETADIRRLLLLSEQENPASINALEEFLATDLLRYAANPQEVQDRLLMAFSSGSFHEVFRAAVDDAQVAESVRLLGTLERTLRERRLWPVRLLTLDNINTHLTDGGVQAKIELKAYVRQ